MDIHLFSETRHKILLFKFLIKLKILMRNDSFLICIRCLLSTPKYCWISTLVSPLLSSTGDWDSFFNLLTDGSFQLPMLLPGWSAGILIFCTHHVFLLIEINFFQKKRPILTSLFRICAPLHSQTWKWRELTQSLNLSHWVCLMGLSLT